MGFLYSFFLVNLGLYSRMVYSIGMCSKFQNIVVTYVETTNFKILWQLLPELPKYTQYSYQDTFLDDDPLIQFTFYILFCSFTLYLTVFSYIQPHFILLVHVSALTFKFHVSIYLMLEIVPITLLYIYYIYSVYIIVYTVLSASCRVYAYSVLIRNQNCTYTAQFFSYTIQG